MLCPNCNSELEDDIHSCPFCKEDLTPYKQVQIVKERNEGESIELELPQSLDSERQKRFKYAQEVREKILIKKLERKDKYPVFTEKLYNYLKMQKGTAFTVKALFTRVAKNMESEKKASESQVRNSLQYLYKAEKLNKGKRDGIEFYFLQGLSFDNQNFISADSEFINPSPNGSSDIDLGGLFNAILAWGGFLMMGVGVFLGDVAEYVMIGDILNQIGIPLFILGAIFMCIGICRAL